MTAATVRRIEVRYQLAPTPAQASKLQETVDTCNRLYNRLLQDRIGSPVPLTRLQQQQAIRETRSNHAYLRDVSADAIADVCQRVSSDYAAGIVPPVSDYQTVRYHGTSTAIDDGKVRIAKIGWVNATTRPEITGKVIYCDVVLVDGDWFVVFSVETVTEYVPMAPVSPAHDMATALAQAYSAGYMAAINQGAIA